MTTLTHSVNFLSSQFDDFGKHRRQVLNTINELENKNVLIKEKNQTLNKELDMLSIRVNMLEQKSISSYFEMTGIPEVKSESCLKIVENIGSASSPSNQSLSCNLEIA